MATTTKRAGSTCMLGMLGLGLVLFQGCDDASARTDSSSPTPSSASTSMTAEDLGALKYAQVINVPSQQLVTVTVLVFRNRGLDHSLSSENCFFDQSEHPTSITLSALIFLPHGPLRPLADTWLLRLPLSAPLEVHDSPELAISLLPMSPGEDFLKPRAVMLAIDPDGEVSSPPRYTQLLAAHISAVVFVQCEPANANDARLASILRGGSLIPHAHLSTHHGLMLPESHYVDLIKSQDRTPTSVKP
jgi:hypothetical protein